MIGAIERGRCHFGDCKDLLCEALIQEDQVQMCVTSPPYWGLRDYGVPGHMGLETTINEYVADMVKVFQYVRKLLSSDGTLWLNIGDGYTSGGRATWRSGVSNNKGHQCLDNAAHRPKTPKGLKPKDLLGFPWRLAFALQADGWYLRQDIIWHKRNPMPESVTDRCSRSHEHMFLLSKSEKYYFDYEAIKEPATGKALRRKRDVWTLSSEPFTGDHSAVFPPSLIEPCILAGSRKGDTVLDPFFGSGTTGLVCNRLDRRWLGYEINREYEVVQKERIYGDDNGRTNFR